MKTITRARRLLPFLALAAVVAACDDLGVDAGGTEVAEVEVVDAQGSVLASATGSASSGTVTVARNGNRALSIRLRDEAGSVVGLGISETIRVSILNTQVAQWSGSTTGTLSGGPVATTTTMRIDVLRAGSVLFSSATIQVQVT